MPLNPDDFVDTEIFIPARREKFRPIPLNYSVPSPYITATSIDPQGNCCGYADGLAGWQSYLKGCEKQNTPGNFKHWNAANLQSRINEAKEIISGVAKWNGIKYVFSWQTVSNAGTHKSLLTIVRFLKRNIKTITPRSAVWKWLDNYIDTYNRYYDFTSSFFEHELLAFLNKVIPGNLFVEMVIPQKRAKLYSWASLSESKYRLRLKRDAICVRFFHGQISDYLDDNPDITTKDYRIYYHPGAIKNLNKYVFQDGEYHSRLFLQSIMPEGNREIVIKGIHKICTACSTFWRAPHLSKHPKTGKLVCPTCKVKNIINPRFTERNIFGGYHSHSYWQFYVNNSKRLEQDLPMGIEVEMHPRPKYAQATACTHIYEQQLKANPDWHELYFERDGSLAVEGIEMVSNPMTLRFAREYWSKILPSVRKVCTGWACNYVNGNQINPYGIHITTLREKWSNLQLVRLIKFVNWKENKHFLWAIAQRSFVFSGTTLGMYDNVDLQYLPYASKRGKLIGGNSRYLAVNLASKKVELRFFASTLNQESFMKNYEFVDAFWHWTKETSYSCYASDFLTWLSTHKDVYTRWPNLLGYLFRSSFYYKMANGTTKKLLNSFTKHMTGCKKQLIIANEPNEVLVNFDTDEDRLCV
jgi:hypothetical protein